LPHITEESKEENSISSGKRFETVFDTLRELDHKGIGQAKFDWEYKYI
jgi:hypothetical protein